MDPMGRVMDDGAPLVAQEQEHRFSLRKKIIIERGKTLCSNLTRQLENEIAVLSFSKRTKLIKTVVDDDE